MGVMTPLPLVQYAGVYAHDFTSDVQQAYGGPLAHKELSAGVWGMIGGDGNADGQVSTGDKIEAWLPDVGSSGYYPGDFDMNGNVANQDKIDLWEPNAGAGGQVPDYVPEGGFQCQVPK